MKFEEKFINRVVNRLLNGEDYRADIINAINGAFWDFTFAFFKDIVNAKLDNGEINLDWYQRHFLNGENYSSDDIAIYSGLNKKTIHNIYGSVKKELVINVARKNYEYIKNLIDELENDESDGEPLAVQIKIVKNDVSVELNLSESLVVLNALATKKLAIRGGAWSNIGKKVEKPLMTKLCELCSVDPKYYDATPFAKDNAKKVDREIDFKLLDRNRKKYNCEVKLMGRGNPESADAVIARSSDVFVADTLSEQNKNQLDGLGVCWVELKNHERPDILRQFSAVLDRLNVPYKK